MGILSKSGEFILDERGVIKPSHFPVERYHLHHLHHLTNASSNSLLHAGNQNLVPQKHTEAPKEMHFTAFSLALISMVTLPALTQGQGHAPVCLSNTYRSLAACRASSDYAVRQGGANPGYCYQSSPGVYQVCVNGV